MKARTGEDFVTRKVAIAVANIVEGKQDTLYLGNLDARRDWSHADDIMRGACLIMNYPQADDYVLASGKSYSVRDFVTEAFEVAGIRISWRGRGMEEKGHDIWTGKALVHIDPALFRPLDVENLQGDYTKARVKLGWAPRKNFKMIVREMVEAELRYSTLPEVQKIHA